MKKVLLAFFISIILTSFCNAQSVNVVFQVHNPSTTPVYVFGSWNWTYWPGTLMTSVGNGYYAATVSLTANTGYEFLFVNGSTPAKEVLDPSWPCTNGNATYTNRMFALGGADTTVCYDWASCTSCNVPTSNVAVTFQVHNPDSVPVHVFGSWSNWANWPGEVMNAIGNGYYTATIILPSNQNYEYLFVNGTGPTKEVLDPTWSCTNGNLQYTNRILGLGGSDTTVCFNWQSCTSCNVPSNTINVKFQVESPDSVPVYVFGSWNNWGNWPGTQMANFMGTTWETSLQLNSNQAIEYLFVNGITKEVLDPSWACTNGNATYTNRLTTLGNSDTTICGVWSTCLNCTVSINSIQKDDTKISLSKEGIQIFSTSGKAIEQLEVYDLMGRRLFASDKTYTGNTLIPIGFNAGSLYLVKVKIDKQFLTFKGLVLK